MSQPNSKPLKTAKWHVVELPNFIQATREVGYRSLAHAVAELVDNALQAAATRVKLFCSNANTGPVVAVLDNGRGMSDASLRTALQFGGTNRFDNRSGLGRFGMGLPCSSFSQARRLDVYSWQEQPHVFHTYLDIDEIARGSLTQVPTPRPAKLPDWARAGASKSGTLVLWQRCDRVDPAQISGDGNRLRYELGRIFRYFIWDGVKVTVNGQSVPAIDPLFVDARSPFSGAHEYGDPIVYKFRLPEPAELVGAVRVRFSELPVGEWCGMAARDKKRFGIAKGAGVSLLRARREIAFGWYFMGEKRKENYDDWWRCEVSFDPKLDEFFRPTHTKQEVHPEPELENALAPDLERIARTLNSRVRRSFAQVATLKQPKATRIASERDKYLPVVSNCAQIRAPNRHGCDSARRQYRLCWQPLREEAFYVLDVDDGLITVRLNQNHPFFEHVYLPACNGDNKDLRTGLECLLFALARAEAQAAKRSEGRWYHRERTVWSNILATFLGR